MLSKNRDLTTGSITAGLWAFAIPLMLGNVLQQFYNLADTWVVGKYIGDGALAAVGSSYTLLTFLTSIVIGLSLGTGAFVSMAFGRRDDSTIRSGVYMSAVLIGGVTLIMTALFYLLLDPIILALLVPEDIVGDMRTYLSWVFVGFFATALYNYVSNLLRSMGNSAVPLIFLGVSVVLNVGLDLLFVIPLGWGIAGAAAATVIAQYASGIGITVYFLVRCREFCPRRKNMRWDWQRFRNILSLSGLTCLQQSVMNLGILMVQAVVNSFGPVVMAAFAVAVKIDTIAYMPVQDLGIRGAEPRRRTSGAHKIRNKADADKRSGILCGSQRSGVHIRAAADGAFCGRLKHADRGGGRGVPPDGGRVLHRHRDTVHDVRVLPGGEQAVHVRGADGDITGHQSPVGECPVRSTGDRRVRHMDSNSDRLVPGGRSRGGVFRAEGAQTAQLRSCGGGMNLFSRSLAKSIVNFLTERKK